MFHRTMLLVALVWVAQNACIFAAQESESPKKPKFEAVGKQDAAQLIDDAKKALAFTIKSSRAAGKELAANNPAAKPFLQSLQKVNKALDVAKGGLEAKDKSFFRGINDAKAGVTEMGVTWDLTRSQDEDVIAGAKKLSGSVSALQENYNPLSQRKAKGGDLTESELKHFQELKAQQTALEKKLKALASKANDDTALDAGLKEIYRKSRAIARAPVTVSAYVDSVDLLATLQGLIGGYDYYLPSSERQEWETVSTYSESWESYYSYESYEYNWSETEESVEVYDDYSVDISSEEMEQEEEYVDDTSFEMNEEEITEVADESEEISDDEVADDEMQSVQEEEEQQEDAGEMSSGDDGGGSDDGGDSGSDGGGEGGGE